MIQLEHRGRRLGLRVGGFGKGLPHDQRWIEVKPEEGAPIRFRERAGGGYTLLTEDGHPINGFNRHYQALALAKELAVQEIERREAG